jgi:hypothetical protein
MAEVMMSMRLVFTLSALLAAAPLALNPVLACERHQNHTTSLPAEIVQVPAPAPQSSAPIMISPAAAALSATEPAAGPTRCYGYRKLEQALTQ